MYYSGLQFPFNFYCCFSFLYLLKIKAEVPLVLSAVMLGVHRVLTEMHPDIVTIIVPRDPQHGLEIAQVWY